MSDEQIDKLMTIDSDAHILVKGKITDVGEVMGYYLQIDDFEIVYSE